MTPSPKTRLLVLAIAAAIGGCGKPNVRPGATAPGNAAAQQTTYLESMRPQLSYSPARNWMNDPNGLVYYEGEYHLFYQYNPNASGWGDMSWGHAVSADLVHWKELPVALPVEKNADGEVSQHFFSGSAVVDADNTSGFGQPGKPPLVAMYTSVYPHAQTLANGTRVEAGAQAQSLAYSVDRGRSWIQYAANPVILKPPAPYQDQFREFRDPKVFWYAPEKKWVMVAVLANLHKAVLYSSPNLRDWQYMSEFGPGNAVGGPWECPDLFALPVDGAPGQIKWVFTVSLNPGGRAGGSGAQYFTGQFDGKQFTADDVIPASPPSGTVFQDFEGASYAAGGWTGSGTLDLATSGGNATGQGGVAGYQGARLANTFIGGDAATGTITSPVFQVSSKFINLMVGGGRHRHDPLTGDGLLPAGTLLFPGANFEAPAGSSYESLGWSAGGDLLGQLVAQGTIGDQQALTGYLGQGLANTFAGALLGVAGDAPKGSLTPPTFTVSKDHINFLVGGGAHPWGGASPTAVLLKVDGKVVRSTAGRNDEKLSWATWDVREFAGKRAHIVIVDDNAAGWGHINADEFMAADRPFLARSQETAVKLIIDGKVVRSATGDNSEALSWRSWNVAEFVGKAAQIEIADRNRGRWGHILVDHIVFSGEAKETANWLDFGSDYYAAVTWNGTPDGKRIAIGWLSNWDYAGSTPESPWRGAQAIAREWKLRAIDGKARLVQQPVAGLTGLRGAALYSASGAVLDTGVTPLPMVQSALPWPLDIEAEFKAGSAKRFGMKVHTGSNGDETVIGYDAVAGEVFIDRSKSGLLLDHFFGARHGAPLALSGGLVKLRIVVDTASVTVFANDGEVVLTDQIFPGVASNGLALFSDGGTATAQRVTVWPLKSIWAR